MTNIRTRYVGNAPFYRRLLSVALPIMLQNGITNFVNMLDNIMVGAVGTAEMTGVAIANLLLFVFNLCIFGAISGAGIFTAQFFGQGNHKGVRDTFRFKLIICVLLTAAGLVLFWFCGSGLIRMYLTGDGTVENAAASQGFAWQYLQVMMIGLLPFALTQAYAGTLRETNQTVLPMLAGLAAVLVNMSLNYVLIFGHFGAPKLGVVGAAVATVTSRFVELIIVAVWTHTHGEKNPFIVGALRSFRVPAALVRQIVLRGTPLMVNEALWATGIAVVNQCYSIRGLDVVAASNISQTFWNVFSVSFMAVGIAIGILVGQLLGGGKFDQARDTVRKAIVFSVLVSIVFGGLYAACAGLIPLLYNTSASIRDLAVGMMRISACCMPINAFAHASYFTIRSGGKTMITFIFDSGFVWAVSVSAAFLLTRFTSLPLLTVFTIVQLLDIIKVIVGYILMKKGIWLRNIVDAA